MENQNTFFERYGSLRKYELLNTIDDSAILSETLAFEAPNPFPGYYDRNPFNTKPLYIYFVVDFPFSQEMLLLAVQKINSYIGFSFSVAKAIINICDEQFFCVRVRNINSYEQVRILQEAFIKEGLIMKKKSKECKGIEAIITIKKFFQFVKINNETMFDLTENDHAYFKIYRQIDWQTFVNIASQVKRNVSVLEFDSAIGLFFEQYNVINIIRIFCPNINVEIIQKIKNEYEIAIKRFCQ